MSNKADFIKKCPQATYNMFNSPHLRPAFVFDRIFYYATIDISKGKYESQGISPNKLEEHNLETLRRILRDQEVPKYKIDEFFLIDVAKTLDKIREIGIKELDRIEKNLAEIKKTNPRANFNHEKRENEWKKLKIIQDPEYRRLKSKVDLTVVENILKVELQQLNLDLDIKNSDENSRFLVQVYERFQHELYKQNDQIKQQIENYLTEGVNNVISNVYYHFFAHDGPKWTKVTPFDTPIVRDYFYFAFPDDNVKSDELKAYEKTTGERIHAHNGWVMGDDPLRNFANPDSTVYFRRQLIAWGDSAKLRFGNGPQDNPELWDYMTEYTVTTAKIFHGVRLDNCHSTPIHVAQYFLDKARSVRPNLYIIAELFTNSEQIDNMFITELGITSLIRESLNAFDSNDLGRLVHRFGGEPAGSFIQQPYRPLLDGMAHAILYDITHDNPSLIQKHSVYDVLPTSSLVLMSGCATGSTRGFDELVPHHIHVVNEERVYASWQTKTNSVSLDDGILKAKLRMNKLHHDMGIKGFSQIYVDQFDADTTTVTRHNPNTHENIILIARTSFTHPNHHTHNNLSKPLTIPSKIKSVLFEMNLQKDEQGPVYKPSETYVNGLSNYKLKLKENVDEKQSDFIERIDYDGNVSYVHFKYFPPGTIIAFDVVLNDIAFSNLVSLRRSVSELMNCKVDGVCGTVEIEKILNSLSFDELNILLFRCSNEEGSENINSNSYDIPKYGPLVYCGLQGFMNILEKERLRNNLGHPMFENLRNGDWMMSYISDRLRKYYEIKPDYRKRLMLLSSWLSKVFESLSKLPRYLIPRYFDLILTAIYTKSLERCLSLMSHHSNKKLENFKLINGSSFLRALAIGGVSLTGYLRDAIVPETVINNNDLILSLSAGLPYFSMTYMRNWGRDTFISLKGLLLLTNRQKDARNLILSYGSCLRHGLIPNLLGEGRSARYNARDAVWFWLKSIKDYCEIYDSDILSALLYRLYPTDDAEYPKEPDLAHKAASSHAQKLCDVIQEALTVHLNGLKFRERNAGPLIDDHMSDEGFNNEIGVDLNTGFVFGGNQANCGTWCDKMGSSIKAGNNGKPATPRDGSAVELVGLCRSVLDWLIKANAQSKYPYNGATLKDGRKITWTEWAKKIDDNFEKHFWIGESTNSSPHINKRSIYKDSVGASQPWADYQFRPNFLIALAEAPQMVSKENALKALEQVKLHLMNEPNQTGIKTLDSSDYNYCGYYDNSNRSEDSRVAHGFNYHQGPEWLWPVGYYLRALLHYSKLSGDKGKLDEALSIIKLHTGKLCDKINSNDWKSLPELTNRNGEDCYFSCSSQAWSLATIMEVFYDLAAI